MRRSHGIVVVHRMTDKLLHDIQFVIPEMRIQLEAHHNWTNIRKVDGLHAIQGSGGSELIDVKSRIVTNYHIGASGKVELFPNHHRNSGAASSIRLIHEQKASLIFCTIEFKKHSTMYGHIVAEILHLLDEGWKGML